MTKPKHAGGRPTHYRREMCDRLVDAMAKGLTAEAAAARIGISARSLFNWQKQHPEFLQAIQEGRQRSQLWWEKRTIKRRGRSTRGLHSDASQPIRQALVTLDDPREERFVALYVENSNGTQAAIAAGYAPKSAHVTASRLLRRAKIMDAIARRNAELMVELDFTPNRIVREIAKVAGVNMADFVSIDDEGNPHIDLNGVNRRQLAAVGAVEGPIIEEGRVVKPPKIRMHDKLKALDMLAKLARMYPAERTELTGADGGPIQSASVNVHKIDIASLEPEQREHLKQVLLALKAQHEDNERQANRGADDVMASGDPGTRVSQATGVNDSRSAESAS
jgi:phage terminase small subunit